MKTISKKIFLFVIMICMMVFCSAFVLLNNSVDSALAYIVPSYTESSIGIENNDTPYATVHYFEKFT